MKYQSRFVSLIQSPISSQKTKFFLVHAQLENLRKDREPRYYRMRSVLPAAMFRQNFFLLKLARSVLPRAARYYREPRVSHINFQVVRCEGLFPTRTIHSQNRRPCSSSPATALWLPDSVSPGQICSVGVFLSSISSMASGIWLFSLPFWFHP